MFFCLLAQLLFHAEKSAFGIEGTGLWGRLANVFENSDRQKDG
jgi:hypothetical protein